MINLTFVDHQGTERSISVEPTGSLMNAAIYNDVPGIEADCGGACACATCHVFIDPAWTDRVGPAEGDEVDMLSTASDLRPTSRLSCQVKLSAALDGLRVETPAYQG